LLDDFQFCISILPLLGLYHFIYLTPKFVFHLANLKKRPGSTHPARTIVVPTEVHSVITGLISLMSCILVMGGSVESRKSQNFSVLVRICFLQIRLLSEDPAANILLHDSSQEFTFEVCRASQYSIRWHKFSGVILSALLESMLSYMRLILSGIHFLHELTPIEIANFEVCISSALRFLSFGLETGPEIWKPTSLQESYLKLFRELLRLLRKASFTLEAVDDETLKDSSLNLACEASNAMLFITNISKQLFQEDVIQCTFWWELGQSVKLIRLCHERADMVHNAPDDLFETVERESAARLAKEVSPLLDLSSEFLQTIQKAIRDRYPGKSSQLSNIQKQEVVSCAWREVMQRYKDKEMKSPVVLKYAENPKEASFFNFVVSSLVKKYLWIIQNPSELETLKTELIL